MKYLGIFVSLLCLTAFNAGSATPTFFWDFETEIPNVCSGGACEPHYSAGAHRSTESPKDGSWSLKNIGAWSQGGVHNYTNDHVWAPMTEGTVEFDWQYFAPYSQRMLFQFSGDWTYSEFDHNDGINLKTSGENEFQLGFGYSTTGGTYETVRLRANVPMVDGKWYHIICKYKQGVGMELTIDGQTFSKATDLAGIITENRAWHNICLGNDQAYACTQYLDNFIIYDHWVAEGDTSAVTAPPLTVTTSALAAAEAGSAYSAPLAASGGSMPYAWEATGLPAGLSVNGSTISGTPAAAGTVAVTVTVTDGDDSTASAVLQLVVVPEPVVVPPDTTVDPPDTGSVPVNGNPTFFWDFETETPNICNGGSCEPGYSAGAHLSTEQAAGGNQSLKNIGAWSQGGVHNYTTEDCWAPMTEGTVEFDWQYWGPYSQRMLFQFSGDWSGSEYDHNDGISLKTRSENEFQFGYGYSTPSGSYKTPYFRFTVPMVEGKWYHIICKYKQGTGFEVTVDGQTFSKSTGLDSIRTDRVFHNICLGNDLRYDCTQYLDNFTIYDHWTDSTSTSGVTALPGHAVPAAAVAAFPNPMRDRVSFIVAGNAVHTVTVFGQDGQVVHMARHAGVQHIEPLHDIVWDGNDSAGHPAAPGIYLYRIETSEGTVTGSFMKMD